VALAGRGSANHSVRPGPDATLHEVGIERLPEIVEGPRLVLRRWGASEVRLLADAVGRNVEHLRPWMPWVADEPLSCDARRALLERWERDWVGGGDVHLAVRLNGRVVGGAGLHRRRGPHGLEIGYWVDKDHLRSGVATETARMLTGAALSQPGTDFVEIHHDKANVASGRVPARLGYRFVGEAADRICVPGEAGVDCAWRMDGGDWSAAGGTPDEPAATGEPVGSFRGKASS
jgi:ribosomal-protein-serine acetyltransferase